MAEHIISDLRWATMATENRQGIAMPSTRLWRSSSGPKPLSHFLVRLRPLSRLPGTSSGEIPGARAATKPDRRHNKGSH
eukprot:2379510-Pyramimonas_sp.AAC.1